MKISLLLIAALVTISSCTKKREQVFTQGQGQDLISISELDNKIFNVETQDEIGAQGIPTNGKVGDTVSTIQDDLRASKAGKVEANSDFQNWKTVPVKIKTDADLAADVPFVARPHDTTHYKIQYRIDNNYLVVYKLAEKAYLHPTEIPGAIAVDGSNLFAVPLVAYPVLGFFNVENAIENNEKSNKLVEMKANDKGSAKFVRVDHNARTLYKLEQKLDVFPKSYFDGDWYYAETIIATDKAHMEDIGSPVSQYDQDLNPATKIRFAFTSHSMRAITTNVDKNIDLTDELNQNLMLTIPIEYKAYRPTPKGKDFEMKEEEVTSIDWTKKDYIKMNFEDLITNNVGQDTPGKVHLVDIELDNNYFSYTIKSDTLNQRIKYSFLKTAGRKVYKPKLHLEKDFEKFGFFTTKKVDGGIYDKYRQEDLDKNTFINRFNVADGEVIFYFTQNSDEKLIPYAIKAIDEWDKAFAKAGVALHVKANTTKRVALGDLRYNAINLIRTVNQSNLFGFGPSISDPDTGEIISATTNMHMTSLQGALVDHIRNYMLFKAGKTKQATLFVVPPEFMPSVVVKQGEKGEFAAVKSTSKFAIKKLPVMIGNQVKLLDIVADKPTAKDLLKKSKNWGREYDLGISGKYLNEEISQFCPELVPLIANIASDKPAVNETKIVIDCAEKLLPQKMLGTLLHEMGHNFGLRHNFYGSVDAINFLSKEETGTAEIVHSSSVMEYPAFSEARLTAVGKYDIAAIRYGYGDAVETVDGKIVALKDTKLTIQDNLQAQNLKGKEFKFCTDEDVELNDDPLCARHDTGTTPLEIVNSKIQEYDSTIAEYNYRSGRAQSVDPARVTHYRLTQYWVPMKRIYDEWRFKLVDYLGQGNEYLDNYDAKSYAKKLAEMKADKDFGGVYDLYKPAADKVFQHAMMIASLPTRYCIGQRNGILASTEFSEVRKAVYNSTKFSDPKVVKSCMEKEALDFVVKKMGFTPTIESGFELEDVRYNMDPKAGKKPFDIIGLMPEKNIAVTILTVRAQLAQKYDQYGFIPNMLDEPDNRDVMLTYLADRLSKGVSADKLIKTTNVGFLEKFKNDKHYIDNLVSSVFSEGLDVPDKDFATRKRKKKFALKFTDKKETLEKAIKKVLAPDGTSSYVVIEPDATEAIKLLDKLETLPTRIAAAVPVTEETFLGLVELAKAELGTSTTVDPVKFATFLHRVLDDEFNPGTQGAKAYVRPKEEKENDKNRVHWKKLLGKEVGLIRGQISDSISEISGSWTPFYEVVGPQVLEKIRLQEKDYNLNLDLLQNRINSYVAENKTKPGQVVSNDIYEYDELQTQYELILSLLRRMADY